jgi:RimJ/RimL family protein N-acetyltransferase
MEHTPTKPYTLRRPSIKDADACIAIHCDPRTNVYRPGGATTAAEARNYIPKWLHHWNEHGFGYWSVVQEATAEVVGFGGVMVKSVGPYHGPNLYFRLSPSVWGQGLSILIGRAAFLEAFVTRNFDQVFGLVRPNNLPSRRALERLGMASIGSYADVPDEQPSIIYAISRSAYGNAA